MNSDRRFAIAAALMDMASHLEARPYLEEAVELAPDDAEILYNIGVIHGEAKQIDEAILAFKHAIDHLEAYVASDPANAQYAATAQGLIEALQQ